MQELSHANGSNKHNLNPWFSFYSTFIFGVLYSNFPPFSLAAFFFLLQNPISNGRAITRQACSSLIETLIGVHLKTIKTFYGIAMP